MEELTAAGWAARRQRFGVRGARDWALDGGRPEQVDELPGVNVVAVKEGALPDALVVVAHADTVPGSGGADDNGSGLAALVELARLLGPERLQLSVVLAAVDHEELGFHGARALVARLRRERPVRAAYVLEMLGYVSPAPGSQRLPAGVGALYRGQVAKLRARGMPGDFLALVHQQRSREAARCLASCLAELAGPHAPVLLRAPTDLPVVGAAARRVPMARDFARSDHVAFWEAGLPAVQVTDTANFRNPHYHRASDLPGTLGYAFLADVTAATALALLILSGL
ncbi:M20/M25/M40 family metallo-hydrolase [Motilibacter aurantiacus]|uniref:M20/M25/M40 family metallo-hydrolase n=1 Tax=Motilibacter aurantiacus TaxID=2714955 RepID=UPI00140E1638|nr:M20/M25/M40 family metallo-hydrolase [Motilibacter aurantiacus]NHC46070.1 M28 family peptidase [Motilibacter aurantiacus]